MPERDPFAGPTDEELPSLPTVYGGGLLRDHVVLVTGGGGGIGKAIAYLFGRLGATIVACGRDPERLARLEKGLANLGVPCFTRSMTIRDPEAVSALVDTVWERYGRLDVLVNNAGGQFAAPALDITPKGWNAVIDTNLNGTWYTMQAAARRWRDHGRRGVIVNISVPVGRAKVGIAHTVASRAAQLYLSKTLAVEWAPLGIRINCVALGVIASAGLEKYPPSARASFAHNPMRRPGDVQDVAEACVYLAAPSAKYVTGSVLTVDGGGQIWGEFWPLGRPDYFKAEDHA